MDLICVMDPVAGVAVEEELVDCDIIVVVANIDSQASTVGTSIYW